MYADLCVFYEANILVTQSSRPTPRPRPGPKPKPRPRAGPRPRPKPAPRPEPRPEPRPKLGLRPVGERGFCHRYTAPHFLKAS